MPVVNSRWLDRPSLDGMEQVRKLLLLIDHKRFDGVVVATNFTFRWIQPCKETAHPAFEFRGDTDGTHQVPEQIAWDEVMRWIRMLFNLIGQLSIRDQ